MKENTTNKQPPRRVYGRGLEGLREAVALELEEKLAPVLAVLAAMEKKLSTPGAAVETISGRELAELWEISPDGGTLALQKLGRRCRRYGLEPLSGTRGWTAVFRYADVVRAGAVATGELRKQQVKRAA